jgi:hypothetical protein
VIVESSIDEIKPMLIMSLFPLDIGRSFFRC